VGDSGSDLSMMIEGSSFIGFNPTGTWSVDAFKEAGVPIVKSRDLREIWPILMDGEEF
jgi:phosphoserine phosphatase